jgi:clan AA aspartic protease
LIFLSGIIYICFKQLLMGLVYTDIELINDGDLVLAKHHVIGEEEIKRITINILVDTGALNLCINENIQAQLQLPFVEKRFGVTADGRRIETDMVGPVKIKFKNRNTSCLAMVLPGDSEPLLGAIPMEDLLAPTQSIFIEASGDVIIHPQRLEMMVNPDHPNFATMSLRGIR